jgi:PAS domain S-box-containing protein
MIPAAERDYYCPVTFMIPFEPNVRAYGFDLLSQSDRRQALWAARDLGEMRASASVTLVQGERGFLLVTAVYRTHTKPTTIEARRTSLTGFCIGVFPVRTLVREALNSVNPAGVNLALFDATDEAVPSLLDFQPAPGRPGDPPARAVALPHGLHHRTTMEVAGRTWQIVCTPSPAYLAAFSRWQSWSVLTGGAALTAFLVLPFVQHRRFSDSLQERVARRTKQLARAYQDLEDEIKVRYQAELALRRSQQQLQAILDYTTAVVYVKDRQGRYLLVNERYKWLFNLTEADILGRTDHHIFPAEVADIIHANDLKVLEAQAPLELEEVVPVKQGEPRTYISIKFPLRDESGAACAVCGISTDITERKRMEEALRASQQRYDLIINGIKDGIWDWNLLTNEVYFSPQWKSMLGYAEEEVENNFAAWQKLIHPDDAERATLTIQTFLNNHHQVYELEHRLRHRDGTYRWILARGVALRDACGQPVRLAGSHVDLTEHKRSEEQLRAVNTALEERQRELTCALDDLEQTHAQLQSTQLQLIQAEKLESIGKLAAGVAHEVKNPLQTMLMGLTYLEDKFSHADEGVKLTCADMRHAINRADSIVRGLLQMSGSPQLNLSLEDVNAVLEKVLSLVNYSLDATRITVVRRFDPAMPRVRLDLGKMEQVFLNLLTNAIHALPEGGTIYVRTFAETDGPGGTPPADAEPTGRVVVQIQDTGPGIPPEHLDQLFTPFFTTKQNGLGTGLGLSVTKSIVELHGGRIELGNAPGGGALATVTLQTDRRNTYEKSTHTVHR